MNLLFYDEFMLLEKNPYAVCQNREEYNTECINTIQRVYMSGLQKV